MTSRGPLPSPEWQGHTDSVSGTWTCLLTSKALSLFILSSWSLGSHPRGGCHHMEHCLHPWTLEVSLIFKLKSLPGIWVCTSHNGVLHLPQSWHHCLSLLNSCDVTSISTALLKEFSLEPSNGLIHKASGFVSGCFYSTLYYRPTLFSLAHVGAYLFVSGYVSHHYFSLPPAWTLRKGCVPQGSILDFLQSIFHYAFSGESILNPTFGYLCVYANHSQVCILSHSPSSRLIKNTTILSISPPSNTPRATSQQV